ncbi:hypothetical protein [Asaia bogorensis]|uniref:hypothetical protein n=1 Tax=Asaia bogorensis TaxID=91915 RepID=UPI000EFDB07A|nr:hypothetical protein [Asaia bogorensis]
MLVMNPAPDATEIQAFQAIISGGVTGAAFQAIQAQLKAFFDPAWFSHAVIPAKVSQATWKDITRTKNLIGLGWSHWSPESDNAGTFRGTLSFPLILMVSFDKPEQRYLGAQIGSGAYLPGMMGLQEYAIAALQGFTIEDIGTCRVTQVSSTELADWNQDGKATVVLEITIPDVALDLPTVTATLNDFLRLQEQLISDQTDLGTTTITVREE